MSIQVAVVTTSRADYGLLYPLLVRLRDDERFELTLIATGSHLREDLGYTLEEIEADGFRVFARVALPHEGDSRLETAHATGAGLSLLADALAEASPDVLVVLGDRYEAFAAAAAALIVDIPVAHIHGGELTFGSLDDPMRHAITKMATVHFASAEVYQHRIVQMGEPGWSVFNVGALAVDNVIDTKLLTPGQFAEQFGVACDADTLLVTYHPVTRGGDWRPELDGFLAALDQLAEFRVLITAPNADAGGREIAAALTSWVAANSERAAIVASLGRVGYLSAARNCAAVVGNSSSGLIEVPALHVPSVDIGLRQEGRLRPASVVHCESDTGSIVEAVRTATSAEHRELARTAPNPYGDGGTAGKIVAVLADADLKRWASEARFVDLEFTPIDGEEAR